MNDVRELLALRAAMVEPPDGALQGVVRGVRRRRIRRRVVTGGAVVILTGAGLTGIVDRSTPGMALTQLRGDRLSKAVRSQLGIIGPTKGAGDSVVVRTRTPEGESISLVRVASGTETKLGLAAESASVSPDGAAVVAVTRDHTIVVVDPGTGRRTSVGRSSRPTPAVSWNRDGTALFAAVSGHWIRVTHPGDAGASVRTTLRVPRIPGGPLLLSISPAGDRALLFGVVRTPGLAPVPHLFVGDFDGTAVTGQREIQVPPTALEGPMGWVGDNAFLLAPGPGRALIVRTDGGMPIRVAAREIDDPCALVHLRGSCIGNGPWLLGTNMDGSLLFWKITASAGASPSEPTLFVSYYRTWLDGTHALRLTGAAGRYGPPVAAR